MEKELISFIEDSELSPFNRDKTVVRTGNRSIYKTKDAKSIHYKLISNISSNFVFPDTTSVLQSIGFAEDMSEVEKRKSFFFQIDNDLESSFLRDLRAPKKIWAPKYNIVVVTEDEKTFNRLKEMDCPVKFILTENDVLDLETRDIVQVIDCENFSMALERLPQSVILGSVDEAYLERYVEDLSGWKDNLDILEEKNLGENALSLVRDLKSLMYLASEEEKEKFDNESAEVELDLLNSKISTKMSELTLSGSSLMDVLSKGVLPENLDEIVKFEISNSRLPEEVLIKGIPVKFDEKELERFIRRQDIDSFSSKAEEIKGKSESLKKIPEKLAELEREIVLYDFKAGVSAWISGKDGQINISDVLKIESGKNTFIRDPKPISFYLNDQQRCSILTGANSGGKTTLLEHIIQIVSLSHLGLPVSGRIEVPLFSEVYYFAKNKGSMSKGAFETLLNQMSEITPGKKTLILADEIEAVTEPGVAGKMISATADFFIKKDCFLVIATHLGQEIAKFLPERARIDGIEAKGLDERNELIIDHNPVLGRLAHSTPELIVEKMARQQGTDYFIHLDRYLKQGL